VAPAFSSGHVFISYRQKEPDKRFARKLARDISAAGHPVWIDVQGIDTGETWNTEIQKALDECYAYVVVLSPQSMESRWVRNELLYALQEKPDRIYPIMFREVRLPPELIAIQYSDFQGDYKKALAALLDNLPPPGSVRRQKGRRGSPREIAQRGEERRPVWLLAGAALAVVAVAVGITLLTSNARSVGEAATATSSPPPPTQPTEVAAIVTSPTITLIPASLGSPDAPIVFEFYASSNSGKALLGGRAIADKLSELTGLTIKAEVATSYQSIVQSICTGKVQVSIFTVISYLVARERGCAEVSAVAVRSGSPTYTSQIIAFRASGIVTVSDLKGKSFCRVDASSPSGWIMPSLLLKAAGIDPAKDLSEVKDVGGHAEVVKAVYNLECDAGGTFSDAPTIVLQELPEVYTAIRVLDTTVPIPNDTLAFQSGVPAEIRDKITQALIAMTLKEDTLQLLTEQNSWAGIQLVDDSFYDPFRKFFESTGYKLEDFID
jgi:phosphonate transport system substrate-binding protein